MNITGPTYWNERYAHDNTPWDIGSSSTPLIEYFKQLKGKHHKILIPGCGSGYEAIDLLNMGFKNTHAIDMAPLAMEKLKTSIPEEFHHQMITGDFFELEDEFDIIVEQTFFCALHPSQRNDYAIKMNELLSENGKLMGLLFDDPLNTEHPPYGGNKEDYAKIFDPYFNIEIMETARNSIKPRMGRELFILMKKKTA